MGNDFINDNVSGKGAVSVVINDSKGNQKYAYSGPQSNKIGAVALCNIYVLCFVGSRANGGAPPPPTGLDNLITDPAEYTNATKGGIVVVGVGGGNTLLACQYNGSNTTNYGGQTWFPTKIAMAQSGEWSGSNSFYDNGTVEAFNLTPRKNYIGEISAIATHAPTAGTFEYSSGDTITVNWTVSFS